MCDVNERAALLCAALYAKLLRRLDFEGEYGAGSDGFYNFLFDSLKDDGVRRECYGEALNAARKPACYPGSDVEVVRSLANRLLYKHSVPYAEHVLKECDKHPAAEDRQYLLNKALRSVLQ